MATNDPFFIVGSGRSGTTLLRLILASHSRIEIPPETWFLLPLTKELPLTGPLSPAQVRRAVDIIVAGYRWPDMGIGAEAFAEQAASLHEPCLRDIADLVYREFQDRSGKPRCGDKTPPYVAIIPQIAAMYPEARFIHLLRDGRDVVTSFIDADFPGAFWHPDFEWRLAIRTIRACASGPLTSKILEVRYEDLVSDPEGVMRRICAFLDEAFEPGMLQYQDSIGTKVPERERAIHTALAKPISSDAKARWRSRLGVLEQFAIESCMYRELLDAGYELRFAGRAWRPALRAAGAALQTAGPLLRKVGRGLHNRGLLKRQVYIWRNYERAATP